jgi:hypothetical protein
MTRGSRLSKIFCLGGRWESLDHPLPQHWSPTQPLPSRTFSRSWSESGETGWGVRESFPGAASETAPNMVVRLRRNASLDHVSGVSTAASEGCQEGVRVTFGWLSTSCPQDVHRGQMFGNAELLSTTCGVVRLGVSSSADGGQQSPSLTRSARSTLANPSPALLALRISRCERLAILEQERP